MYFAGLLANLQISLWRNSKDIEEKGFELWLSCLTWVDFGVKKISHRTLRKMISIPFICMKSVLGLATNSVLQFATTYYFSRLKPAPVYETHLFLPQSLLRLARRGRKVWLGDAHLQVQGIHWHLQLSIPELP